MNPTIISKDSPLTVSLFGVVKGYLYNILVPGPLGDINQQTFQDVKTLCDEGYGDQVIECLNSVKNKLSLDQYYHVKNTFRYLEEGNYQFNYDFFKI